jgi:transposase InsO family protein
MAPLELIYSDICEMNGILTEGGQRYFMTMIDDVSTYCYVSKDKALNYFKTYNAEVENQLEKKIKRFRSDHGGKYFSNESDLFYVEHGIIHERTSSYSSQSNEVAKRKNRILTNLVNSILDTAGLSMAWWGQL